MTYTEDYYDCNWRGTISFDDDPKRSNLADAIKLVKKAFRYQFDEDRNRHVGMYSAEHDDFRAFRALYKIVQRWKTCRVEINGQHVENPTITKIINCYGAWVDWKLGNNACEISKANPFGCACIGYAGLPEWWQYDRIIRESLSIPVGRVDIRVQVGEALKDYGYCPRLNRVDLEQVFTHMPAELDAESITKWVNWLETWQNKGTAFAAQEGTS